MEGLYRRGQVFWYRFSRDGHQYRLSTGERDEARAILAARALARHPEVKSDTLFREVELYLADLALKGRRPNYVSNLRDRLRDFAQGMGGASLCEITRSSVQVWFNQKLSAGVRPQSAVAYLDDARRFFKWALEHKKVRQNPCNGVREPAVKPRRRERWLSKAAATRFIDECTDRELKYLLFCALHCGMRKDEAIMSRPGWFDLEHSTVRIPAEEEGWGPKDRTGRSVPLTLKFRDFLVQEYGMPLPFMVQPAVEKGAARYRYDFKKKFNSYTRAKGLEDLTYHDLRRSFGSILVNQGISPYLVARWLGDDLRIFAASYGHLEPYHEEINALL